MTSRILAAALTALTIAGTAQAQQEAPASPASPVPAPAATLPPAASAVPPPISVLPVPTPTVSPPSSPDAVPLVRVRPLAAPTPRATPSPSEATPEVEPTPTVSPTATPSPTPAASTPSPEPSPVVVETPSPSFAPAVDEAEQGGGGWLLPAVAAIGIAALILFVLSRRRRHREEDDEEVVDTVEEPLAAVAPRPAPVTVAAPPAPRPVTPSRPAPAAVRARAWLAFEVRPLRAGVNLLTATLEAEVIVRNEGDAVASDIRLDLRLLSARSGDDDALEAFFADPIARAVVPPFTLAPGESRSVVRLVTLPRGSINVLTAGGRPMFVPLACVNIRYASEVTRGQVAGVFAIGVERDGADKLAPFRLDVPARMQEKIASRPHGMSLNT